MSPIVPTSASLRRKSAAKPATAASARARHSADRSLGSNAAHAVPPGRELARLRESLDARTDELAAAQGLLRATLESAADGMLVTDEDGRVTAVNEKFLRLWGLVRAQVEHAGHAQLVALAAPRLREPARATRRVEEIQAGRQRETRDRIELLDGQVIERFSNVQHFDGRGASRVWSYRDITARLRAEHALRDEAGVLHFLNRTGATIAATLEIAPLMQTVIDAATQVSGAAFGAFFYRNDKATPASVLATEDEVPASAGEAAPAAGRALAADSTPMLALAGVAPPPPDQFDSMRTAALFGAAWGNGQTVRCADVTTEARYGRSATYFGVADGDAPLRSFLAVPVTLGNGTTVGGLFFGHPDIGVFSERTERIVVGLAAHAAVALDNARLVDGMRRVAQERERLVAAERMARAESVHAARIKDEFLSTLSHELRTPLTAILGWAKVLLLQRADDATRQRGLEAIARNAGAQAALIEDLLDMSRIVSGKVQLEVRRVDLAAVISAALAAVRKGATAKGVALASRVDEAACQVPGDPARLQQVVEQLLSNAIKFTPAGGRVEVGVAEVGGEVELFVSDTGAGIAAEFLPHLFDQFRQADASTTRRHGGLGLGLAIVRQLAGLHGGAVSARSDGPGLGARFVVRLPRDATSAAPADAPPPGARRAIEVPADTFCTVDLRGLHLLVVDDDADVRESIAQVLIECGADVRQAGNADEALREFERDRPDVLLSDIGMPDRDGYELIRDIRGFDVAHGGAVPAVALTAFARSEDRAQAMLAGYQAHIAKPVQPGELVNTVAQLAERKRAA